LGFRVGSGSSHGTAIKEIVSRFCGMMRRD
jgi:hypothetical protein